MDSDSSVGRNEAAQWEDIYRKFSEITSMLTWAEMAVSPGDASTLELPSGQASAIAFCVRRARVQLQEIHERLQAVRDSEAEPPVRQALDTST